MTVLPAQGDHQIHILETLLFGHLSGGPQHISRMDKNRKWCFTADPEKAVECFC